MTVICQLNKHRKLKWHVWPLWLSIVLRCKPIVRVKAVFRISTSEYFLIYVSTLLKLWLQLALTAHLSPYFATNSKLIWIGYVPQRNSPTAEIYYTRLPGLARHDEVYMFKICSNKHWGRIWWAKTIQDGCICTMHLSLNVPYIELEKLDSLLPEWELIKNPLAWLTLPWLN